MPIAECLKDAKGLGNQSPADRRLVIETALLASLIDSIKENTARNLTAIWRFSDTLTDEAHNCIMNEKNAVAYNIPDRLLLPLVKSAILNVCSVITTLVRALGFERNTPKINVQFNSNFVINYLLGSL